MTFKIIKTFKAEAAHRLMFHQGKCRGLHGHSYLFDIIIQSDVMDRNGMVLDFDILKDSIGRWIDLHLDHATILREDDPLVKILEGHGKLYLMSVNPTAEELASHVYYATTSLLRQLVVGEHKEIGLCVSRVICHETASSSAEFSEDR